MIVKNQLTYLTKFNKNLKRQQQQNGRNHTGIITVRHRGGGNKVNFKSILNKLPFNFINFKILNISKQYRYRNALIAQAKFLFVNNNIKKYNIIIEKNTKINNFFYNFCNLDINNIDINYLTVNYGNFFCLKNLPIGTFVYNIEKYFGFGGIYIRSAGCFGNIVKHDFYNKISYIKLMSKQIIKLSYMNRVNIGIVSNEKFKTYTIKKAGENRWYGIRPSVRGVAMNAVDHPHGGGRGKSKGGRASVSLWGKLTKGKKTVKNKIVFHLLN